MLTAQDWKTLPIRCCGLMSVFIFAMMATAGEPVTLPQPEPGEAPQQPQVAVAGPQDIYIAFGAGKCVYCVASQDGGKRFGKPVRVATLSSLMLGSRRGPRVAVAGESVAITAIGERGELLAWRSNDHGQTWHGPVTINDVPKAAREGLHALAAGPNGELYCVWLDLRNDSSEVFGSRSDDGGRTWSKNQLIYRSPDGNVCECCHPSVTFDAQGNLYVMWRNWLDGNRDLFLSTSKDDGRTFSEPRRLGQGHWKIDHCPMDGGAVAVGKRGEVATVCRREKDIVATLPDQKKEVRLGRGEQPWIAANAQGAWITWISRDGGDLSLQRPNQKRPEIIARHANDPVVSAPLKGHGPVVLVWEEGQRQQKRIRVQVVSAK